MAVYHGKKGVVYCSTSAAGAATNVIKLDAWSLDMPADKVETTAFGDTNKTYVLGLRDASGSISGFWDDTADQFYAASQSSDGVNLYLYPSSDAPSKYWYGPAWVDFSVSSGVAEAVKIAANFSANGAWGKA